MIMIIKVVFKEVGVTPTLCRNRKAGKLATLLSRAGIMIREIESPISIDYSSLDFFGGQAVSATDLKKSSATWDRYRVLTQKIPEFDWEQFRREEGKRLENLITNPENKKFMMRGTGFDVITQVTSLKESYLKSLMQGVDLAEIKSGFAEQVREDLKGYFWEFVQKEPVLKIDLSLAQVDEKVEVITPKYNNKRLIDTVNSEEREGATKIGITRLAEKLSSGNDGIYTIASPKGWSGFYDQSGREFLFPESQFYMYVKDKGQINGFTFRNNLTLQELRQIAGEHLTNSNIYSSESDQIKELVSTVLEYDKEIGLRGVLQKMSAISGSHIVWTEESSGKSWTFDEALEKAISTKDIWEINQLVDSLIDSSTQVINSIEDLSDPELTGLIISLGKIALQVRRASRLDQNTSVSGIIMTASDYAQEANMAQQDKGCIMQLALSSPFGSIGLEAKKLCCTCPFCKQKVEAEIYGGQIHCPNCNRSATWSMN